MTTTEILAHLLTHAEAGGFAHFEQFAPEDRKVHASVIRDFLMTQAHALRIYGAHVEGDLELCDARRDGDSSLPALFLHHCDLSGKLRFQGAKLNRLSIQGSRFCKLNISSALITGALDCSYTSPYTNLAESVMEKADRVMSGSAYILGKGVRVGGEVRLDGARFQSLPKRDAIAAEADKNWAVQLNESRIQGTINLSNCVAEGGVNFSAAHIEGNVWCYGTRCSANESVAFQLQGTYIAGALRIDQDASMVGGVAMLGAKLGHLVIGKSTISPDISNICLLANSIEVMGSVAFGPDFVADKGQINLDQARVHGGLRCDDCRLQGVARSPNRSERWGSICFSAQGASIGGDLTLYGTVKKGKYQASFNGTVLLAGLRVAGDLEIIDCRLACFSSDDPPYALVLSKSRVGGDVRFVSGSIGPLRGLETRGSISLAFAEVGGNVDFIESRIATLRSKKPSQTTDDQSEFPAVTANGLKVRGSVSFLGVREVVLDSAGTDSPVTPKTGNESVPADTSAGPAGKKPRSAASCRVLGALSFAGAEIGRDFKCLQVDLESTTRWSAKIVDLSGSHVDGELTFEDCLCIGSLDLTSASLIGALDIKHSGFRNGIRTAPGVALNLESARLASRVELLDSRFDGQVRLDFCRIDGPIHIVACKLLEGTFDARGDRSERGALRLEAAEIRGDFIVKKSKKTLCGYTSSAEVEVAGSVDLSRAQISGMMSFSDCKLICGSGEVDALLADGLQVKGECRLGPAFDSTGLVTFTNASIGSNLKFERALLHATPRPVGEVTSCEMSTVLQAERMSVSGSVEFRAVRFEGSAALRHASVGTNLHWTDLVFVGSPTVEGSSNPSRTALFDLQHIRIGGALEAKRLKLRESIQLTVDLTFGSASTLEDNLQNGDFDGWGQSESRRYDKGAKSQVNLILESFTYQSLSEATSDLDAQQAKLNGKSKGWFASVWNFFAAWRLDRRQPWFTSRLAWLKTHHRSKHYRPQPYRRLSLVLRAQGYDDRSREVAIQGRWEEFRSEVRSASPLVKIFLRLFVGTFGKCFGFGLDPWRALTVLAALIALGTAGGLLAAHEQVLVSTTSPVETRFEDTALNSLISVPIPKACEAMSNVSGKSSLSSLEGAFFYSVNLALPIVQLHQKAECEIASTTSKPGLSHNVALWHFLENTYSIFAKLFTSLALITFSGVLRRSE